MENNNKQHKTKIMSHQLLHKSQQGNKQDLIDVTLLTRPRANRLEKH
jgi:hypothetical protein